MTAAPLKGARNRAEFASFLDVAEPCANEVMANPPEPVSAGSTRSMNYAKPTSATTRLESPATASTPSTHLKRTRSNSTSSVYTRWTFSNPDSSEVLTAMASVLHAILQQSQHPDGDDIAPKVDRNFAVFDERLYVSREARPLLRWRSPFFRMASWRTTARASRATSPTSSPTQTETNSNDPINNNNNQQQQPVLRAASSHDSKHSGHEGVPPREVIYEFLHLTQDRAEFNVESMVIALILLNRLLSTEKRIIVHTFNWRLLLMTSILVAQKIFDDRSLGNESFPTVWKEVTQVEESSLTAKVFSDMEAKFLETLNFSVFVSRSLYAAFVFELRHVYEAEFPQHAFPIEPLSPFEAMKVEQGSSLSADEVRMYFGLVWRKCKSGMDASQGAAQGFDVLGGTTGRLVLS